MNLFIVKDRRKVGEKLVFSYEKRCALGKVCHRIPAVIRVKTSKENNKKV